MALGNSLDQDAAAPDSVVTMTEVFERTPGLVRIGITAADTATAREAAERVSQLWLSSTYPLKRVPGEDGVHVLIDADLRRSPEEGGIPEAEGLDTEPPGTSGADPGL